ncbi:39S ribosomal protein L46, mitochondrial-like isoform X2 [Branchiostoma floridae]|uniref:Large ribosomal subunit protein mL46 n=1 Tax=Branchiostoma floridae TaxID=7739 RepID=A0A9J7MSW3_BRAFL|nr:39S ribosomal protein L46, mitochondrial-like isoform X2 [Branchiostoma floridae]
MAAPLVRNAFLMSTNRLAKPALIAASHAHKGLLQNAVAAQMRCCVCGIKTGPAESEENSSQAEQSPWTLMSAVCMVRRPLIMAELSDVERRYKAHLEQLHLETSVLSDHELQLIEEKVKLKQRRSRGYDDDDEDGSLLLAADKEDLAADKFQEFQPADRLTEADMKNDRSSQLRKLGVPLYLLVKQKLGDKAVWVMPQGSRQEGETLRQTAERILLTCCGTHLRTTFYGNAPCGFYKYKYPRTMRSENNVGAKVFFFKAELTGGDIECDSEGVEEFAWVTPEEMKEYLPQKYLDSVLPFATCL